MNKNTIIGTLLISILIFFYVSNSAKTAGKNKEKEIETEQVEKEEIQEKEAKKELVEIISNGDTVADSSKLSEAQEKVKLKYGEFYKNITGEENLLTLENDLVKIDISNKGAQISKVELKNYKTWDQKQLMLIDATHSLNLKFASKIATNDIETENFYFDIERLDENSVSCKLKISETQYYEHIYTLSDDSYFLDFDINFVNVSSKDFSAEWDYNVIPQEKGISFERQKSNIFWKTNEEDIEDIGIGGSKEEELVASQWIAFKDQFFNTTILTGGMIEKGVLKSTIDNDDTIFVANYNAVFDFDRDPEDSYKLQYFFGPNDYKLLKSYGNDQEEIVELGSSFFIFKWVKYISKAIILPLFNFLNGFNLNYGIIIILITLIIRMAMMPLTFKSYVSTAKTKLLKPQIDKLKEKYKDDQQKFASEQMALYKKTGVSMFGGCLPMLLQMPFFLAMFYFFPSSIEFRQESFLWANDLSTYDAIVNLPFNIPIYGKHISGFTLLMTLSSLLMARFNPQMQNNNMQPGMEMMKYMPYIFPIFLLVMFNSWSSALTLYYFVSNLVTLGQQLFINKFMINEDKLLAQIEANKKKPQKKGGFRDKLEEMAKKQQLEQEKKKK